MYGLKFVNYEYEYSLTLSDILFDRKVVFLSVKLHHNFFLFEPTLKVVSTATIFIKIRMRGS